MSDEPEGRYVCLVWDVCDAEVLVGRALMAAIAAGTKFAPTLAEGLILAMGPRNSREATISQPLP